MISENAPTKGGGGDDGESWRRAADGRPATREELLMVLAQLETILIKLSYLSECSTSTLLRAELELALEESGSRGPIAAEVEECQCPNGYVGTSCEVCANTPLCRII